MKREFSPQFIFALVILLGGGAVVGGEYLLVKRYPEYRQRKIDEALELRPYKNDTLGVEMGVAAGLHNKVEDFAGGVRFSGWKFWGTNPTLSLAARPNPEGTHNFDPNTLAKWQTAGTYQEIPRYRFQRTEVNGREAVIIWQWKGRAMHMTARVISPEKIVEVECTPGSADETLYMEACERSVASMKVAGPERPAPEQPVIELTRPAPRRR
jgi:hypothetical protein